MRKIFKILKEEGLFELINKLLLFFKYNLIDKYQFIYLVLNISDFSFRFSENSSQLNIRIAEKKDIKKIEKDIYPFIGKREEYDKKFISRIGDENIVVFIYEKNNKIIHYSLVFKNAIDSPFIKTPLNKSHINNGSAYLGSVFTVPNERGIFILPTVLGYIVKCFSKNYKIRRLILLVHPKTTGASRFYEALGFKKINNSY